MTKQTATKLGSDWITAFTKAKPKVAPVSTRRRKAQTDEERAAAYERRKQVSLKNELAKSASARDIAVPLKRKNLTKYINCRQDFRLFCEEYMPNAFPLKWSADHLRVIDKIEKAVLYGDLLAIAMPRGSGKTTLVNAAATWSLLYAHRSFVTLIGADEPSAENMLESIVVELETNERLLDDFPEVIVSVKALEGIKRRAEGQTWRGERTRSEWTNKQVMLPTILAHESDELGVEPGKPYPTSGAVLDVAGITGRLRGRMRKRADGAIIRPDLVLIDDPQTDESAKSPKQVQDRMRTLNGAVLGLSGPGKKIAGLCTVTVVYPGDLADKLLDRKECPQWQGERTKLLYEFPENRGLWDKYAELRLQGLEDGNGLKPATEFYGEHREAMDKGSRVAWDERKNPDELSALQHAMNLKFRDEVSFLSEYQNDPLPATDQTSDLTPKGVRERCNGLAEWSADTDSTRATAFIDVQGGTLWWVSSAWSDVMSGRVISYGVFPEQNRRYVTNADARHTLQERYPGCTLEICLKRGLTELVDMILGQKIARPDGTHMRVQRIMIDANWGQSTDAVYEFCKDHPKSSMLTPSHGRGYTASSVPMSEKKLKKGDRHGLNWRMPLENSNGKRNKVRYALYDTNFWKGFVVDRLLLDMQDEGGITLFGSEPRAHEMLADNCCAEYKIRTEGRGRTVDEFKLHPGQDNHLWDGLVGSAVAASIEGAGPGQVRRHKREKVVSFAEQQRIAREKRQN